MNSMQFLKGIKNPKEAVMLMMKDNQNPVLSDLFKKVQNGDTKSVESFARNLMKEQGRDFDKEFGEFMKNFK